MNKHRLAQHWHGIWFLCSLGSLICSAGALVWHGHGWVAHKQDAEAEKCM
jgi:hypothetical protein